MEFKDFQDFAGKNYDEAVEIALKTLGKTKEEVNIEVLQESSGKAKFFGFSLKSFKIRVFYHQDKPEIKEDQKEETDDFQEVAYDNMSVIGKKSYDFLKMTLGYLFKDAEIEKVQESDEVIQFFLHSENPDMIIGKSGILLESLQVLTYLVGNKHEDKWKRILINIDDYREKRETDIHDFIRNIAGRVKKTRRPFLTRPYSPYERRIIHMIIQEIPGLESVSEGNGLYKKVWIKSR
ncbi:MAG TPA: hypothetical protein DHW82_10160 [Spirochaetia bacterium]|nr:MAG: hypothetical protein A2Y41_14160 [Spirochaetes bacterium GWB1_36_13]HCL57354.1 hypothetical protein [Spirochaetia bacterium]